MGQYRVVDYSSTGQYRNIQYRTVKYNTVHVLKNRLWQYNMVQGRIGQKSIVHYRTGQYRALQGITIQ